MQVITIITYSGKEVVTYAFADPELEFYEAISRLLQRNGYKLHLFAENLI